MLKFTCTGCRYIYNPYIWDMEQEIEPGTDFFEIREDWTCPVCGESKDSFVELVPIINEPPIIELMTPGEEKHTPFYKRVWDEIIVRIWDEDNLHPTEDEHFIEYLWLFDENIDEVEMVALPDVSALYTFDVSGLEFFEVRLSCNLHWVWKWVEIID